MSKLMPLFSLDLITATRSPFLCRCATTPAASVVVPLSCQPMNEIIAVIFVFLQPQGFVGSFSTPAGGATG
jgi:hypothetical protein